MEYSDFIGHKPLSCNCLAISKQTHRNATPTSHARHTPMKWSIEKSEVRHTDADVAEVNVQIPQAGRRANTVTQDLAPGRTKRKHGPDRLNKVNCGIWKSDSTCSNLKRQKSTKNVVKKQHDKVYLPPRQFSGLMHQQKKKWGHDMFRSGARVSWEKLWKWCFHLAENHSKTQKKHTVVFFDSLAARKKISWFKRMKNLCHKNQRHNVLPGEVGRKIGSLHDSKRSRSVEVVLWRVVKQVLRSE